MKVGVVFATYNKDQELPNFLYALNRQKTTHEVEVYIVDDCSFTDPKPIIDKYLTNFPVHYQRLEERASVMFSHAIAFNMVPEDVDVILQPSADVVCLMPNILHDLCEAVEDRTPAFAQVIDLPVDPDLHKNFEADSRKTLDEWDTIPRRVDIEMHEKMYHGCSTVYSGFPECSWLFFMGAMKRKDFEDIGFGYIACDAYMHPTMRELGFRAKLLPWLKCIHQRHYKQMYKCHIVEHCPYWCIQKDWAKE